MAMTNEEAHALAREKGVSRWRYAIVRGLLMPVLRLWFRLRISGAEHIPADGAAIVTPNHKSFWDSFFIALATTRHLRFMGKSELFEGPWGKLLVRLGAFPVRRGKSDEAALATAREILRQGGLLALFPEGTRVSDPEGLGEPRRGATRMALETGAVLVPTAITGTDHLWMGPIPKPKRVQVAFSAPIPVDQLDPTPETAQQVLDEDLWPEVESSYGRLRSNPGLIAAGAAALGLGAFALSRRGGGKKTGGLPLPTRGKKKKSGITLPPLGKKRRKRRPWR